MGGGRHGGFVDFYVGSNGQALPGRYRNWIGVNRREKLLKYARNPKLVNAIKQLYRPGSFIGDGGTASVLKFEKRTGIKVGHMGNSHLQKSQEMARYISNKVLKENLSKSDKKRANGLLNSLRKAIAERSLYNI